MFEDIKTNLTRKIIELRIWLNNLEDSDDINKGLYYVYIYGIFEETIREIVQQTISCLNSRSLRINDCSFDL